MLILIGIITQSRKGHVMKYRIDVVLKDNPNVVIRSKTFEANDDKSAFKLLPEVTPHLNLGYSHDEMQIKLYCLDERLVTELPSLLVLMAPSPKDPGALQPQPVTT